MHVPIAILVALALLATPTAVVIIVGIDDWLRRYDLRILGRISVYRDDHSYIERLCLLCVPVWTRRGYHSTWLDD